MVDFIEELGASRVVYAELGGTLFAVTVTDAMPVSSGDAIGLQLPADKLHAFDAETAGGSIFSASGCRKRPEARDRRCQPIPPSIRGRARCQFLGQMVEKRRTRGPGAGRHG